MRHPNPSPASRASVLHLAQGLASADFSQLRGDAPLNAQTSERPDIWTCAARIHASPGTGLAIHRPPSPLRAHAVRSPRAFMSRLHVPRGTARPPVGVSCRASPLRRRHPLTSRCASGFHEAHVPASPASGVLLVGACADSSRGVPRGTWFGLPLLREPLRADATPRPRQLRDVPACSTWNGGVASAPSRQPLRRVRAGHAWGSPLRAPRGPRHGPPRSTQVTACACTTV